MMNHVILTVDLGFGDAGKGSIVDFLTRHHQAHTVIRYNGGAQAGHRVVSAPPALSRALSAQGGDGGEVEHVFSQFGSGTLAGAATHLSRFMLLEPLAMVVEEKHLRSLGVADAFQRTTIDERALVVTPFQRAVNRLRELARGTQRHGSCGMGIGETVADSLAYGNQVLFAKDLTAMDRLVAKLSFLRVVNLRKVQEMRSILPDNEQVANELELIMAADWCEWLVDAYRAFVDQAQIVAAERLSAILHRSGTVIFEGAQGVLLDEWHGFHPYTTWSTTTLANAERLLTEAGYTGEVSRIGITRAYATRHGAGPFVSEDATLTKQLSDARNEFGAWQQGFRVGWLDLVMLRYALEVVGHLDGLAVTCLDRLQGVARLQICERYQQDSWLIDRITPSPTACDLDYQAQLTRVLEHCQPILQRVADVDALLARLSDVLALPIKIVSYGAMAQHKQLISE